MANPEHIEIVKQGAVAVAKWQREHESTRLDLSDADLSNAELSNADLRNADFNYAKLNYAKLKDANLSNANLWNADLGESDLSGANLINANLGGANLIKANLGIADLTDAALSDAALSDVNLNYAKPSKANLSYAELTNANLRHADLSHANLSHANLSDTDFTHAILDSAILYRANLSRANLSDADLGHADISHADISSANLRYANISGANLRESNLSHANVSGARCGYSMFANLDLSQVVGLESISHIGPSQIGVETLYKSQGKISEAFLRGCGVPDGLIEYLPSLLGMREAIQYYSCFISYSHKDEAFCKRLYSRMRDEHLRVWYAPEDIKSGKKIHEQIDSAIQRHDKLLLVLSETSMASEWVQTEIYHARQREQREGRQVLFPIRIVPLASIRDWSAFDADTGRDMAREIREYFIPDFSNWKDHDAFETGFARLLKDLNAHSI